MRFLRQLFSGWMGVKLHFVQNAAGNSNDDFTGWAGEGENRSHFTFRHYSDMILSGN
jgi:hypothetical protein